MEPLQQGGMSPAVVLRLCSTFPYVGSRKQKPRNVGEIEENLERSTEYNALTQKKLKIGAANRHCQPRLRKSPCLGGRSASPCSCWCRPRSRPHRDQSGEMRNCVFFFFGGLVGFFGGHDYSPYLRRLGTQDLSPDYHHHHHHHHHHHFRFWVSGFVLQVMSRIISEIKRAGS